MQKILFPIIILTLLFISPVSAETLASLTSSFSEAWNGGNIPLPSQGVIVIPQGPGILTTTTIQEPFKKAGLENGPTQVQYQNSQNPGLGLEIGMFLGATFYQKSADIGSSKRLSEDIPLTRVTRYYTCLDHEKSVGVQLLPAIEKNTNHQLANKVSYSAIWEPLEGGRATEPGCDISGVWKTNKGNLTMSETGYSLRDVKIDGSYSGKLKGSIQGTMSGPVLTGSWTEQDSSGKSNSGRFTIIIRNDCCAFTGTWGVAESDTNGGEWSGVRY
ncbi:MAG TPA: hypothetical protein VN429_04670 [Methanospirillum sp.]|uniref:hypothetical protein n=1 Tax=Methanospirillum sp. TaxID=45200 RepID=UPI002CB06E01|nr:hypothetical protein [Methanospirillum sp.]HWQ63690.1 hypothetical protein [Methanospirillum sp.]